MSEKVYMQDDESAWISVQTYKYDGAPHKNWRARLALRKANLLILDAMFDETIHHPLLGTIERGTRSTEYYWLDRPYNVFRFSAPGGGLRFFYCNVTEFPKIHEEILSYVDLDIDVLVAAELSYKILDEDEFAANAARYQYPESVRLSAASALRELTQLIEAGGFPFNNRKAED